MHMVNLARCAALFAVVTLASTSALAADCAADADEANAKCYPTLQAAVDAALSTDRPLILPRGSYQITAPLVIDYSRHAGTGFELISRGATIDGTAVGGGPALIIECAADCFYFDQEGTLFANADTDGPAVVVGKADFSDPHNSGKLDHLIVNNRNAGAHATGCQFNYVLNWDIDAVCVSGGGGSGLDLEQLQFSTLRGAASATTGTAITLGPGYIFANTFEGLDLEASKVCISDMYPRTTNNTWTSPYLYCPTGLVYSRNSAALGQIGWQLGGDVQTPYIQK
jgi:hypothetical protein